MKHLKLSLFTSAILFSFTVFSQTNLDESMKRGKTLYTTNCITCHMANGEGMVGAFPPLAKSDYLMQNSTRSIKTILNGASGEMKVNGTNYYGSMIDYKTLSNQEIADILNYIRNNWGNKGEIIKAKSVAEARK